MNRILSRISNISLSLIVLGIFFFIIGLFLNNQSYNQEVIYIKNFIKKNPNLYNESNVNYLKNVKEPPSINYFIKQSQKQIHNRPWSSFYVSSYLFFGISVTSLFFLCIQNVSQSGWSVIILRVMEAIASFIPYGGILIFIVIFGSLLNWNHIFHWMEHGINDSKNQNFDLLLSLKSDYLNKPFFIFRIIFCLIGFTFLVSYVKKSTKKLDNQATERNYWKMYKKSVITIIFFGLFSSIYTWDFIMSIDAHWYSTLFSWYFMISHLVSSIACIILFSILFQYLGLLSSFNDNHLHDLAKYLFGFSLLWAYLWFSQFMLYWYSNIPEEVIYFLSRFKLYQSTFITMLIPNFLIPFLVLISSSIKRNIIIVSCVSISIILGHWLDCFNAIMPGTVGPFWNIGLLEIGSFIFIGGLFIFIVINKLDKINIEFKGNPLFEESKLYKYPF